MERKMEQDVLRKLKRRRRRRLWRRLVSMMMCVVVFCTTYALILPAITKETEAFCGFEAHVHTGACYPKRGDLICEFAQTEIHIHTEDCHPVTEETPSCGLEEIEAHVHTDTCVLLDEKVLCCTLKEGEGHTHSDTCAPLLEQTLSCKKVETEGHIHTDACQRKEEKTLSCTAAEAEGHTHTDACGLHEVKTLSCTAAESEGHTHTDACGRNEERILSCNTAETTGHTHTDACSRTETVLTCDLAETEEHAHGDGCYTEVVSNVCGMEEVAGHSHTDACYTVTVSYGCNREEAAGHTHTDACYTVTTTYDCGLEEAAGHTHTDACYTVTTGYDCGLEEAAGHTHTDACYTVTTTYGCGLEEAEAHAHTDECYTITTIYGCGLEEAEAHTHGDACYTAAYSCGLKETEGHAHSDACYRTVYDCGQEAAAHVHTEACYAPAPGLVCTLEENGEHTHGVSCYTGSPVCGLEEHEHTLECYSDPTADLEGPSYWESTLPGSLTGNYAEDLLAVARSQLGYTESTRNYIVDDSGEIKGYTRYGAWYGFPHGDWCAMFVSFCLHYAKVDVMPIESSCANWVDNLRSAGMYAPAAGYTPQSGDIIFFDWNGDANPDHVGIVAKYFPAEENDAPRIQAIEGNCNNTVCYTTYNQADPDILGYGILPVQEIAPTEIPELPEETIGPRDTNAWAVLVDSGDQTPEEPEAAAEETVSARAYGLRKMSSTFRMAPRAGGPLDLTPYINAVTMYDESGNIIPSGSVVTEGDMIEFRIEYTVTGQQLGVMNGETVTVKTDTLLYDLPDTFQIIRSDSGNILNSVGQQVGSYVIDSESGTITMNFTNDYVEQNAKGIQIHGYISFFSTVEKIYDTDSEDQDYQFADDIKLGITVEEYIEAVGDLTIEKKKLSVDGKEIVYEVTVTSAEGTKGPITIQDQMSPGLTFKEGISVTAGNGSPVNNVRFNAATDKKSFELELPEMKPGDTYTVRYRCTADIGLLDADMTVRNTATVTGKDSQDNDLRRRATVTHTFDVLEKTGEANGDGTVTWTITINQAKLDISGWTLDDIMGYGDNGQHYTGPVTIKRSNGTILARNATLPYKFPSGSDDTYTVTYTTSHDYGDGETIYNSAILRDDDTEVNVLTGVGVIGNPFEKTGEAGKVIQDENGNYLLPITWTVTIDTANGPIPGGQFLIDKMYGYPSDDMYMTYDQLMAACNSIDAAVIEATGAELLWFSAHEYAPGSDREGASYGYTELTTNEACKDKVYERFSAQLEKEIPQGEVLTFSYEAYGIFPNNLVSSASFVNRFNLMEQYEVEARVNYTAGKVGAKKMNLQPVDPEDVEANDWLFNGDVELDYEDLKDGYLGWAIELSVPPDYAGKGDIVLFEDLPEGVSVKRMDMSFLAEYPTGSRLTMQDLKPGNNYRWDFYMMNEWGGATDQKATITVDMTNAGDLEITVPGIVIDAMAERAREEGRDEWWVYLYIYAQIDEEFDWPQSDEGAHVYFNTFENSFELFNEDGDKIDKGSTSQSITKDESDSIIRKQATADNNNVITYSVVLNAYGRDLIENSDKLNIHDELTYASPSNNPVRLRLVPGSVKLYEIDMNLDGSYEKLGVLTSNYSYAESSAANYGTTNWTHTIDLTVPDGKALLLEYQYIASGVAGAAHDVFNTCTISGVGEGGLNGDHKVEIDVKQTSAQADIKGVMLYKVDASSDGIFLENARFNIYIWNKEQGKYIIVHHPKNGGTEFTTNAAGMIVLDNSTMDQFAYNTAYYIVEVESPNGYYLSPEPYYFQIVNPDTKQFPSCLPEDFDGHDLSSGDIIYRKNVSEFTEITVKKHWQDYNGKTITVTGEEVKSVTLELWQMIQGNPDSAKQYGTYTMTPDEDGNWSLTIKDLPKATKDQAGIRGTDYLYYVKEVAVNGYSLESSENNQGIKSGEIELVNRKQEGYELPETGGAGTNLYTMAGLLLMLTSAAYLMYSKHPRRREEF